MAAAAVDSEEATEADTMVDTTMDCPADSAEVTVIFLEVSAVDIALWVREVTRVSPADSKVDILPEDTPAEVMDTINF